MAEDLGECWTYNGQVDDGGYGRLTVLGRTLGAHRIAYVACHGPIPPGKWVLHRCDNPPCIRGSHLYAGDQAQNVADMMERTGSHGPGLVGADHPNARMAEADVLAIRAAVASRPPGPLQPLLRQLADQYGVTVQGVKGVVYRRTWRHL